MLNQLQDKPHQCQTELTQHTASLNKLKKYIFWSTVVFGQMFIFIKFALPKPRMTALVLKLTGDNNNNIRGMVNADGVQVFSVYDFITTMCVKNDKGAFARRWYKDNIKSDDSDYSDEFFGNIHSMKFEGNILFYLKNSCTTFTIGWIIRTTSIIR